MSQKRGPRRSKKSGMPPGALVHIGEPRSSSTTIRTLVFDETEILLDSTGTTVPDISPSGAGSQVTWVHVLGSHDPQILEQIGQRAGIHPLVVEDILNTDQRPKIDAMDDYRFLVLKHLSYDTSTGSVHAEQVSLVLFDKLVISLQESDTDLFAQIRDRLVTGKGKLRKSGSEYLAYALVDNIVDGYFPVLDHVTDEIDDLEEVLLSRPTPSVLRQIHALRRELVWFRRNVAPVRELVSFLERDEDLAARSGTRIYWRDIYDHASQVLESVESYRDIVAEMLDIYLSGVSNRTNDIMKVLTIMSTIFIPLTFITSLYGMNFEFMPELSKPWAYPVVLTVMAVLAAIMVIWFKRKRWW